jgi:hypothetical protein
MVYEATRLNTPLRQGGAMSVTLNYLFISLRIKSVRFSYFQINTLLSPPFKSTQ